MSDENLRSKIKETNESKNINESRESMNHVQTPKTDVGLNCRELLKILVSDHKNSIKIHVITEFL